MHTIGEAARRTDTRVETIRYYERIGLLDRADRSTGNYRLYGDAQLNQLSFIRRARNLGFSIEQVRALMALGTTPQQSCAQVDALARRHLDEVERKIADLDALRGELHGLLSQCRQGTIAECRIIEALAPPAGG
ncbi:MerR family transcriptional regulator [Coralloluteibacterium stylophorae]|uniref:Helix-turn-helix domain-containing protein n=1 Tax=Coralloluteibacterium stylophorae TaxID=1776034 RepID=A0A8J8AW42_9GAMM|nr:helix-turn-helix domain-containing protein [Coralloluteibacterium stylophorae]